MSISPPVVAEKGSRSVEQRARIAVAALFFTNGALFANLLPRYPEIKTNLGLSNAAYGLSVAAFPLGAIVAGLGAGVLIRRFGSAKVAAIGTSVVAIGALAAGISPTAVLFAVSLFVAGAMDAVVDVAQNAHGLEVQRRYQRSIINSFHAVWSIGAVTGGVMAAGAIAVGLPLGVHLGISAVVFSLVALTTLKFCLPGRDHEAEPATAAAEVVTGKRAVPTRTLLMVAALVLIAIAGTTVEDAGFTWATLYLGQDLAAPAAIAAIGYIALVGAQFIGRLVGDRLVDRFGQRVVVRSGGVIVALGMGTALAFPSVWGSILGFAAAGFGVATLVPAAMQEADELPGLRAGTGLTLVSWLMRLGFLLSPPVVGAVADSVGLRIGLIVVPAAGILVILLAGVLQSRRTPAS